MLLISNPVAGAGKGPEFIDLHVLPLLEGLDVKQVTTESPGDAGKKAVEYVNSLTESGDSTPAVIIVSGGDGTLHEVANGLAQLEQILNAKISIEIVLLPLGTANALYHSLFPPNAHPDLEVTHPAYKLLSLRSFLDRSNDEGTSKRIPLAIQSTSLLDAKGDNASTLVSVVVTSTSLHASILDTADRLKEERPDLVGVERFKVAAMENITNWYYGSVNLKPLKTGECLKYNPSTVQFESVEDKSLEGPFEYFLSTVNVDRLETDFRITPLHTKLPPKHIDQSMDLMVIRPFRHPKLKNGEDSEENRKKFVEISMAALQHAYKDGVHADLRYTEDGSFSLEGKGEPIVEYFRCGGWDWIPVSKLSAANSHKVILDSGRRPCQTRLRRWHDSKSTLGWKGRVRSTHIGRSRDRYACVGLRRIYHGSRICKRSLDLVE